MSKSRSEYNEYMRVYMLERYYRRRNAAINQLGGRCSVTDCGVTSFDDLEIDHIERNGKMFTLGSALAGWSEHRIQEELKKCQLLCTDHHIDKTITEMGRVKARGTHGTISAVRYCKPICDQCREVKNMYSRSYKQRKAKSRQKIGDKT